MHVPAPILKTDKKMQLVTAGRKAYIVEKQENMWSRFKSYVGFVGFFIPRYRPPCIQMYACGKRRCAPKYTVYPCVF